MSFLVGRKTVLKIIEYAGKSVERSLLTKTHRSRAGDGASQGS
jgi:hypothetical protein